MKDINTGMIRRLDNLGRIVIPKEIRSSLQLKDGDPVVISVSGRTIQLNKFLPINSIADVSHAFLNAYSAICKGSVCIICSTEYVAAARGISISSECILSAIVRNYIQNQKLYVSGESGTYGTPEPMTLFEEGKYPVEALYPVGTPEKPFGAVILLQYRRANPLEMVSAKLIAAMLTEFLLQK